MKQYKSKTGDLLHVYFRFDEENQSRVNISPPEEFLQVSLIPLSKTGTDAHKHVDNKREISITQESWVVVKGKIEVCYYDMDGSLLGIEQLGVGDCSVTFGGGHSCRGLEEDTLIYEFKNGPYLREKKDKESL